MLGTPDNNNKKLASDLSCRCNLTRCHLKIHAAPSRGSKRQEGLSGHLQEIAKNLSISGILAVKDDSQVGGAVRERSVLCEEVN